jgi:hypothetical protein
VQKPQRWREQPHTAEQSPTWPLVVLWQSRHVGQFSHFFCGYLLESVCEKVPAVISQPRRDSRSTAISAYQVAPVEDLEAGALCVAESIASRAHPTQPCHGDSCGGQLDSL